MVSPCDSLVEDGVRLRGGNLSQGRIGSDDVVKLLVVDVEGLSQQRLFCDTGPDKQLDNV